MQIVYARAEKTQLVPTGRHVMRDRNYYPEMTLTWEGRAGMWANSGTEADLQKANRFAETEGYKIFTFPNGERDPLGKARKAVVAEAQS
jgi:hypothetical protein